MRFCSGVRDLSSNSSSESPGFSSSSALESSFPGFLFASLSAFFSASSSLESVWARTSFFMRLRQCSSASSRVFGHGASLRLIRYVSSTEKSHFAVASRFVAKSTLSRSLLQ